jgi:D-alanine-D-alanine ligase
MAKIQVGLVFGGRSGEHEVSVRSAESIRKILDKTKYDVVDIFIDKEGKFEFELFKNVDVFFPIIHGTFGEDGTLQGLFELLDKAYVGAGVLGSAVGMDKDVMKRLLLQAKIPVGSFVVWPIKPDFPFPMFVKPANMGSSVGVTKVKNKTELKKAVEIALRYDTKVIIEKAIVGRELEVSVLGNDSPIASLPGEVKANHEFYDYEAKYLDEHGAVLEIPAKLTKKKIEEIQKIAVDTFKILECKGMARVDLFLSKSGKIIINEINTLPGFTSISMYPKLWEATGVSYFDLLDKLINLAFGEKTRKDNLVRSYE